ncbi:MAG: hypothetical protein HY690_04315 [Chloroflexi bacterium]|nr:hypothetical protein [Chloroflexota bacterium]
MLFFFELLFFVLALSVIVLAERYGRETAVAAGVAVALLSVVARLVVQRRVPLPAGRDRAALQAASEQARWWRATLDGWAHFNRALLAAAALLLLWEIGARLLGV